MTGAHVEATRGLPGWFRGSAHIPSLSISHQKALIDSAIQTLDHSLTLIPTRQIRWVTSLIDTRVSSIGDRGDLGVCVTCGKPVAREDPFLRYSGRYYHGGSCVDSDPPALRARAHLNAHLPARDHNGLVELGVKRGQDAGSNP